MRRLQLKNGNKYVKKEFYAFASLLAHTFLCRWEIYDFLYMYTHKNINKSSPLFTLNCMYMCIYLITLQHYCYFFARSPISLKLWPMWWCLLWLTVLLHMCVYECIHCGHLLPVLVICILWFKASDMPSAARKIRSEKCLFNSTLSLSWFTHTFCYVKFM